MKFSIIVFNYNGGARLENCLTALRALRPPEGAELEQVLVDVDSGSGLAERLKDKNPELRLLEYPVRLGLTESLNQAARAASGQYLVFVHFNQVLHPSWLTAVFQPLESAGGRGTPACAFSGSETEFGKGRVWEAGDTSQWTEVLHPEPGVILVERDVFFEAGEFDGDYYLAEEHVDLGFRIWHQNRSVVRVSGDLARRSGEGVLGHYGKAEQTFFRSRNRLRTVIKNYELTNIYRILPPLLLSLFDTVWKETGMDWERYRFDQGGQKFDGGTVKTTPEASAGLLALDDLLGSFERLRSSRRTVQSARRLGDAEIFSRVEHPYTPSETSVEVGGDARFPSSVQRLMEILALEREGGGNPGP